jgi:hypothetical protein
MVAAHVRAQGLVKRYGEVTALAFITSTFVPVDNASRQYRRAAPR